MERSIDIQKDREIAVNIIAATPDLKTADRFLNWYLSQVDFQDSSVNVWVMRLLEETDQRIEFVAAKGKGFDKLRAAKWNMLAKSITPVLVLPQDLSEDQPHKVGLTATPDKVRLIIQDRLRGYGFGSIEHFGSWMLAEFFNNPQDLPLQAVRIFSAWSLFNKPADMYIGPEIPTPVPATLWGDKIFDPFTQDPNTALGQIYHQYQERLGLPKQLP